MRGHEYYDMMTAGTGEKFDAMESAGADKKSKTPL
jgi:hypothetical protein